MTKERNKLRRKSYFFAIVFSSLLTSLVVAQGSPMTNSVAMSPRFIYVLHGGIDALWGQHMFMVQNQGTAAEEGEFTVVLPAETVDWQAQDGFKSSDFQLGADGGLKIVKTFEPGDNVQTLGFKTLADSGTGKITLKIPINVGEISVMTTEALSVSGNGIEASGKDGESRYKRFTLKNVAAGTVVSLEVSGIQSGRAQFWRLGAGAFALLLVLGLGLAYRNRNQKEAELATA